MAFVLSPPTSLNSNLNFSLSDSVSDIATFDMPDDYTIDKPAPNEKVSTSQPVFEKEGYLNSSMITVIVSPSTALLYTFFYKIFSFFYRSKKTSNFVLILTSSKENRKH